jgi:hypothetical protein
VTDIVTAYLIGEPVNGLEIPDRRQAVDAITHYLLYGSNPPPTLLCLNNTMPRWKKPPKFVPPKYVAITKDLTVLMRTLEATSSDEVIDMTVTISGSDGNKPYDETVSAVSVTCGNTQPGYTERCWSAYFPDIPDSHLLSKNKLFEVTVKSNQIDSDQNAIFIVEPGGRSSGSRGADAGRHIVISHDPPLDMVVAIEYDVSSVDILRPVSDESTVGARQPNVEQSYLEVHFAADEITTTTRLVLTYRAPVSQSSGDMELPTNIIVNGQSLNLASGSTRQFEGLNSRGTIEWPIAQLLQEGENVIQIRFADGKASSLLLERLEVAR